MILNMLSSAIQVTYPAPGEMVVLFPRQTWGSLLLFAFGLVIAVFMVGLIKRTGWKLQSLLFAIGFLPLLFALYNMTNSSTLKLSRDARTLVLVEETFFIPSRTVYPLRDVDHAEIAEDDGRSHMFYIALSSQSRIPVGGGWTPRAGYFQAANAVNVFLNQTRSTFDATSSSGSVSGVATPSMEELGQRAIAKELADRKQAQR